MKRNHRKASLDLQIAQIKIWHASRKIHRNIPASWCLVQGNVLKDITIRNSLNICNTYVNVVIEHNEYKSLGSR